MTVTMDLYVKPPMSIGIIPVYRVDIRAIRGETMNYTTKQKLIAMLIAAALAVPVIVEIIRLWK
jgi:hypothetical protein